MDWTATFHHPGGVLRWGTDERFDDLRHLNRAGAAGWQAYDRTAIHVVNEPHRLPASHIPCAGSRPGRVAASAALVAPLRDRRRRRARSPFLTATT